jgi:hypothetical protein
MRSLDAPRNAQMTNVGAEYGQAASESKETSRCGDQAKSTS